MQRTDNVCDACGETRSLAWSDKYKANLCVDHYNHPNTEDMIFARAMTAKPFDYIACSRFGCTAPANVHGLSDDKYYCAEHNPFVTDVTALHDNDEIVTNEQGGKQSKLEYAFELIEPEFMKRMAHVLYTGKLKYGARNWQNIPMDVNIGRAIYHLEQALEGTDHSEDHFANAACRVMFAMLTAKDK